MFIEYTGGAGKSTWAGKVTRRKYLFGSDESHRRVNVDELDVPGFLAMRNFKIVAAPKSPERHFPTISSPKPEPILSAPTPARIEPSPEPSRDIVIERTKPTKYKGKPKSRKGAR